MHDKKLNVTKTFLPPIKEYEYYLAKIWQSAHLTNQGPLLLEFEEKLKQYLKVKNFHFVTNGTIALQLALRAFDITDGEVITTPFSYVATTSAILWERCTPVFVDIRPDTLCIDAQKIEAAITSRTRAIMPVHVFGNPCEVEAIDRIAKKHKLKVIYDAAHAFGVEYRGRSLLDYGDISVCSFHATKLFHTIEGGGLVTKDNNVIDKIELLRRFGHQGNEHYIPGLNAKASEFQAAMGLCNLKYIDENIQQREQAFKQYDSLLINSVRKPTLQADVVYNFSYYPIVCKSERHLVKIQTALQEKNIFPRRYFFPSLNTLPYVSDSQVCPISEDIATRILCLPLYPGLSSEDIARVCEVVNS